MQWIGLPKMKKIEVLSGTDLARYSFSPEQEVDSRLFLDLPASIYHADREPLSCTLVKHWPDLSSHEVLQIVPWQYTPHRPWREPARFE